MVDQAIISALHRPKFNIVYAGGVMRVPETAWLPLSLSYLFGKPMQVEEFEAKSKSL